MMNPQMRRREGGFTLVELMVVIVILGLLAGVGVSYFMTTLEDTKVDLAKTGCVDLEKTIETYVMQKNPDAGAEDILDVMIEAKRINPDKLDDPWGERYIITVDEDGNFKAHSTGKDKQDGTEDDVWATGMGVSGSGSDGF